VILVVCLPIAIVYLGSYCAVFLRAVNVIHAFDVWVFMLVIECGNRLGIGMGAFSIDGCILNFGFGFGD
jgi:hypothetical protein